MLDLPSVYVDEVLQSGSERGVANFYKSNTYGNGVSQKAAVFRPPSSRKVEIITPFDAYLSVFYEISGLSFRKKV